MIQLLMAITKDIQNVVDLSVTIISTNEKHYLDKMLPLLYKVSDKLKLEVIVVNNLSNDGTDELVNNYPNLQIIANKKKFSFCVNHNLAIERSKGKYILVLNPDVLFDEKELCLAKMVKFMDENPQCGVSGCRVYNFDKEFAFPARRFQNLRIILTRRLPFLFHSEKVLDYYFYRERDIKDIFEVDWLSGSFLFFRREALAEVGLFDEKFPKYFEDVDICKRMQAKKWIVMYHGDTFYYHLEQRSSINIFSLDALKHFRSWLRWIIRQRYYNRLSID